MQIHEERGGHSGQAVASDYSEGVNHLHYLSEVLMDTNPLQQQPLKQQVDELLYQIGAISNESSVDVLKAGLTHLKSALSIMKAVKDSAPMKPIEPKEKISPNANNVLQPRLLRTEVKVCALCFGEDDNMISVFFLFNLVTSCLCFKYTWLAHQVKSITVLTVQPYFIKCTFYYSYITKKRF